MKCISRRLRNIIVLIDEWVLAFAVSDMFQ